MKKWTVIFILLVSVFGLQSFLPGKSRQQEVRASVNKGLKLLQSSSHTFLVNAQTCFSCHGQDLGVVAFCMAKERGYEVDDAATKEAIDSMTKKQILAFAAENDDPVAIIMSFGYAAWALAEYKYPSNKKLNLLVKNVLNRQNADGSWVSPNLRPPLEYYSFTATALMIKAAQFAPAIMQEEVKKRIERAKQWMTKTEPETNEERVFQLLGLTWAGGDKEFIKKQAAKLLALQRKDGGWSQLDSLETDSYATGQALYALNRSGILPTDAKPYVAGTDFLLRTQKEDGSWMVKSRSFPSVPYVDSGFPHGDDQFISAAGSNWAIMALVLAGG